MQIALPKDARVIILEGIAGSGKTTLKGYLKKHLKSHAYYEFTEQELLLGWKHIHVPHMSALRLKFIQLFLDDLERKLKAKPEALFILERFHLSIKVLEWEFEGSFAAEYETIVQRLKQLPVHILIAELDREQIRERMHHRERSWQWREFVEEKLTLRGYQDLETLSIEQQKAFFDAASEQGIPFSAIKVELEKNRSLSS